MLSKPRLLSVQPYGKNQKAFKEGKHLDNREGLGPYISCNSNCNKNKTPHTGVESVIHGCTLLIQTKFRGSGLGNLGEG